jgi:hypothetical protein
MKSAYNETALHNLHLLKEAKAWQKHDLISREQLASITAAHPVFFFHPNFVIRILLFIASLIALAAVTGLASIFVFSLVDGLEQIISVFCILYGIGSFVFLEAIFINSARHYKSGVTEALLYHAIGFTLGGVAGITDFNIHIVVIAALLIFTFSAFRYLDLIATVGAIGSMAFLIFYVLFEQGGILQQIIPILFIALFTPFYFLLKTQKQKAESELWNNCITLAEALTLLIIYAAGNYLVVRELSVNLMDMQIAEGQDIPFAFLFYFLTVAIPILYIYGGLKSKDIVLIRTSLFVLAFSVFTFKYYFSLGHPEITLTLAGIILLIVTILLTRYLKLPQYGYTRENILSDKWSNVNLEAFIISQTVGGNHPQHDVDHAGGGSSSGGGSSDSF